MANTDINKKNLFFHQQIGLKFKEATNKALILEHSFFYGAEVRTLRKVIRGKIRNVALEKDGEDQLHQLCEK
jgi:hypothetical protein